MTDRQTNRERKTNRHKPTNRMKSQHTKVDKDSMRTNHLERGIERARWLPRKRGREVINGMEELISQYQTDREKRDGPMRQ